MKLNFTDKNNNQGVKKFTPLFLVISLASIIGCQSTNIDKTDVPINRTVENNRTIENPLITELDHIQTLAANSKIYDDQFRDNSGLINEENAKHKLMNSFAKHLHTDHVSVTKTRIHDRPFLEKDSIDSNSETVLKALFLAFAGFRDPYSRYSEYEGIGNYDSNGNYFYGEPYRTEDDYLNDENLVENSDSSFENENSVLNASNDVNELYLNYIDEANSNLPFVGYKIGRETGMSYDYHSKTEDIISYSDDIYYCVLDFSSELDDLVVENPNINENSEDFKNAKASYDECLEYIESINYLIEDAEGYQLKYIDRQNGCKGRFEKQINDMFNRNRTYESINYDEYDKIYVNYKTCDESINLLKEVEPYYYINEGWPEYLLQYNQDLIKCADDQIQLQKDAELQGITFKNNPYKYTEIFNTTNECVLEADLKLEEAEDEAYELALKKSEEEESEDTELTPTEKAIDQLFRFYKRSPQQIEATNFYQNQYWTISHINEFNSQSKQVNSVFSYDFTSPTSHYSIQLPLSLDFANDQLIVDPSAVLPVMAIINPENTPLPEEMNSTMVAFQLPDEVKSKIPAEVIYDAFINALAYSMKELDSSYFTEIDIRNDNYAKEVGASSAVKLNLGSKQTGKLIGAVARHMAFTLEEYLADESKCYDDEELIKKAIEKWEDYNTKFQSEDVGTLFQIIEAVLPLSFYNNNYYYFDSKGQLIGKQTQTTIGGDIFGSKSTILSQTSFNPSNFAKDPLYQNFYQSFGKEFKDDMPESMDGTNWLDSINDRTAKLKLAKDARYDYSYEDDELDLYSDDEDVEIEDAHDEISDEDNQCSSRFSSDIASEETPVDDNSIEFDTDESDKALSELENFNLTEAKIEVSDNMDSTTVLDSNSESKQSNDDLINADSDDLNNVNDSKNLNDSYDSYDLEDYEPNISIIDVGQ